MKLLLIRHAEPDYAINSLTEKGWHEAELLSRYLAPLKPVEGVYQSPQGRAQDTAHPYLRLTGQQAITLPWLTEFRGQAWDPDQRRMTIPWDYLPRRWQAEPLFDDPERWVEADMFQGTNVSAIWQETKAGVDDLLARHGYIRDGGIWRCDNNRYGYILCFCHFGIATAMTAYLMGISPVRLWHTMAMQPSSVTTFVTEERIPGEAHWRCTGYGDLGHLYARGETYSTAGLFPEVYDGRDTTIPFEWIRD